MSCSAEDIWVVLMGEDKGVSGEESEAEKRFLSLVRFVRDGGGAADGCSALEHFGWAKTCTHPCECESEAVKNSRWTFARWFN